MEIILIPGFWLDGSAWDEIVPTLRQAGHETRALTLPGMESKAADRSGITLRDHVEAVVQAIDALDPAGKLAVVGHSGGGVIGYAAVDARPDRVARIVYVDSGPLAPGTPINDQLPIENDEVPLPDWSFFDAASLTDFDDSLRARFRARAVPSPTRVTRDPQRLGDDERRYDVPATVICCEAPSSMFKEWMAQGHPYVSELNKTRDLEFIDLPTGHWPLFTKPAGLAAAILSAIDR